LNLAAIRRPNAALLLALVVLALLSAIVGSHDRREAARILRVLASIDVPRASDRVDFDVARARLVVADRNADGISVVDTVAHHFEVHVDFPSSSQGPTSAVAASGGMVFLTRFSRNSVVVLDDATWTQIAEIAVGRAPLALALDAFNDRLYLADLGFQGGGAAEIPGGVAIVQIGTFKVVETIAIDGHPFWIALAPDGAKLAVLAVDPTTGSFLDLIDTRTLRSQRVDLPLDTMSTVFDAGGEVLYLLHRSGAVSAIRVNARRLATERLGPTIPGALTLTASSQPGEILLTSTTNEAGSITRYRVLRSNELEVLAMAKVGREPRGVVEHGDRLYVSDPAASRVFILAAR